MTYDIAFWFQDSFLNFDNPLFRIRNADLCLRRRLTCNTPSSSTSDLKSIPQARKPTPS